MGWFGKKRPDVVDLGERYRRQQERTENLKEEINENSSASVNPASDGFAFLGGLASANSSENSSYEEGEYSGNNSSVEDKRRKMAKRLMDMTEKIEDLTNQIYHLQQRIEVLERKAGVGAY